MEEKTKRKPTIRELEPDYFAGKESLEQTIEKLRREAFKELTMDDPPLCPPFLEDGSDPERPVVGAEAMRLLSKLSRLSKEDPRLPDSLMPPRRVRMEERPRLELPPIARRSWTHLLKRNRSPVVDDGASKGGIFSGGAVDTVHDDEVSNPRSEDSDRDKRGSSPEKSPMSHGNLTKSIGDPPIPDVSSDEDYSREQPSTTDPVGPDQIISSDEECSNLNETEGQSHFCQDILDRRSDSYLENESYSIQQQDSPIDDSFLPLNQTNETSNSRQQDPTSDDLAAFEISSDDPNLADLIDAVESERLFTQSTEHCRHEENVKDRAEVRSKPEPPPDFFSAKEVLQLVGPRSVHSSRCFPEPKAVNSTSSRTNLQNCKY